MVQRLSLHGLVSREELPIALRGLEAVSGMKPRKIKFERQIFEPVFRYVPASAQAAQIEQYRLFLELRDGKCILQAREMPEAGRNVKVISQAIDSTPFLTGNAETFMEGLGYKFSSKHEVVGLEFVLHGHIVVHLFQLAKDDTILDDSQFALDAFVDVDTVTDHSAMERATQLLLNTQQELRGVVNLRVPIQNAFNVRMPRIN